MRYLANNKTKLLVALFFAVISSIGTFGPNTSKTFIGTFLINYHHITASVLFCIFLFFLFYGYLLLYEVIYEKLGVFPKVKNKRELFFHRFVFRGSLLLLTMLVFFTVVIIAALNSYYVTGIVHLFWGNDATFYNATYFSPNGFF